MAEKATRRGASRRQLNAVLTTAFLWMIIVTLVVVSGFLLFFYVQAYQEFVATQQHLIARDAASTVAGFVQEKISILEADARVSALLSETPAKQSELLGHLAGFQRAFRRLMLLDARGQVVAESSREGLLVGSNPLARVGGDWFDRVKQGERYISPVYVDEVTNEPMAVLAVPVTDIFGEFRGAMLAEVNLKFMWDLVDRLEVGETGVAYLVDRKGNLIAFRDIARVLRGENVADLQEVREFIGSASPVDPTGANITRGIEGTLVVATYVPLGIPDWALVTEIPLLEAYRPAIRSAAVSLAVVLVAGVLVAGAIPLVARRLSAPILHLTSVARRIAGGELEVEAAAEGPSEIAELAHTFNWMTAQLRELITNLEQQVAARTADLARRTAQLEAAAYVARRAAEIRRLDALLNETVRLISDRFGFYHAGIFLVDEMGEYAVLRAASSEGGQRMLARGHRLAVGKVGIVGYVAATGEPRIALDVGEDAVFFDNPDLPHTRSEMAMPLKVRDRVIGVLDVQSVEPAAFTREDASVLQTMADQIALAIENARLLEEAQRSLAEIRALYGEYLRGAWQRLARQEPVVGYHHSARGGRFLTAHEVQTLRDNPAIWSVLTRGDVYTQSASGDGDDAFLLAPVRLQEQVIGVLQVKSPVRGYRWSPEDVAVVRSIADRLALALENARLLDETRRHAERDRMIAEITARVRASMDPETILRTALRELAAALGADRVMVRMMSPSRSEEVGDGSLGVSGQ